MADEHVGLFRKKNIMIKNTTRRQHEQYERYH